MIRFLASQSAADRRSLMSYLLFNLSRSERAFFHVTQSGGAYYISAQSGAGSVLRINHTIAYQDLLQTVRASGTVRIGFAEHVTFVGGSGSVATNYGGGVTIPASISTTGDVEAYVSRLGNPAGVPGTGGTVISDPISIILAHELLGHARLMLIGQPSGQPEAIQSENDYRRGRGIEQRQP